MTHTMLGIIIYRNEELVSTLNILLPFWWENVYTNQIQGSPQTKDTQTFPKFETPYV